MIQKQWVTSTYAKTQVLNYTTKVNLKSEVMLKFGLKLGLNRTLPLKESLKPNPRLNFSFKPKLVYLNNAVLNRT